MSFNKNGIISSNNFIDGTAGNILDGSISSVNDPWQLSGVQIDIIRETNNVCKIVPGKTYYLTCMTDKIWATKHTGDIGTVALWLYLRTTYNPSLWGYNRAIVFLKNGNGYIKDGLWRYTIPSGYNMARIRLNTYSDGSTQVTSKFWNINFIPEEDFTPATEYIFSTNRLQQESLSNISQKGGELNVFR